jgi:hypothetical protein
MLNFFLSGISSSVSGNASFRKKDEKPVLMRLTGRYYQITHESIRLALYLGTIFLVF